MQSMVFQKKNNIFHMSTYKSLVICAKTFEIIFISKLSSLWTDGTDVIQDNTVDGPVYCKWPKLILI